ncbi:MAG: ribonuclease HIII [Bacilli bacterium]|jgi:ribonuclease HIII|nr:ribonuclease HIII [Bacilli bacterium]
MEYIKFKADKAKAEEIRDFYQVPIIADPKRKYDYFQACSPEGVQIKAYLTSNDGLFTILFSGEKDETEAEARIFFKELPTPTVVTPQDEKWQDMSIQIGSDEVGVGDFFLGFYVVAVYLDKEGVDFIDSLHVTDSKKLTDSRMEQIGPILNKKVFKHVVRLSPDKLMQLKEKGWSTHRMLASAHNFAHVSLIEHYHLSTKIPVYIDQFEKEEIYKHYVGEKLVSNPLVFRTKGETYFPSVATASVIARWCFLEDWKKMEADLGMTIPKGADKDVDKVYITLVKKYGKERIDPYIKRFFKNYKEDN